MVIGGHGWALVGQRAFVRRHMVWYSGLEHSRRMCSRVLVTLSHPWQWHRARVAYCGLGMAAQKFPIFSALWSTLNMKSCTGVCMDEFCVCFQMEASVSMGFERAWIAWHDTSRLTVVLRV